MLASIQPTPPKIDYLSVGCGRFATFVGKVKMAVQAAARSYGNLSLSDVFGERMSASRDNELTKDISDNFWNDCRFAVPPGTDVSALISNVCKLLSHLAKGEGRKFSTSTLKISLTIIPL